MAMVCPITNTHRGFPFHVAVTGDPTVTGFIMVEQLKSVDFAARKAKRMSKASSGVLDEVLSILDAIIY
jgi:mRNA interferase MazF